MRGEEPRYLVACRGKGWLPEDYGKKPARQLTHEERQVMESFEGEKSYTENLNKPLFQIAGNCLGLEHKQAA